MSKSPLLLAALLPFALAACSMSPPEPTTIPTPDGGSFEKLALQGAQIASAYGKEEPTPAAAMPKNLIGTYKGVAGFGDPAKFDANNLTIDDLKDVDAVGRIEMSADFETGGIKGSIYDMRYRDNSKIDGVVSFAGDITENMVAADLSGSLSHGTESAKITGTLGGVFVGEGAGAIIGFTEGDFSNTFLGYDTFFGAFGASR